MNGKEEMSVMTYAKVSVDGNGNEEMSVNGKNVKEWFFERAEPRMRSAFEGILRGHQAKA